MQLKEILLVMVFVVGFVSYLYTIYDDYKHRNNID